MSVGVTWLHRMSVLMLITVSATFAHAWASYEPSITTEVVFFDAKESPASYTNFLEELRKQGVTARHKIDVRFASFEGDAIESVKSAIASAISNRRQIFVATSVTVAQLMLATIKKKPIVFHSRVDAWEAMILPKGERTDLVTGTSNQIPVELKHLEFWRDARLGVKRLGIISHPYEITAGFLQRVREGESTLGLNVELFIVSDPEEFRTALANRVHRKIDAWYIPFTRISFRYGKEIFSLAQTKSKLISVEEPYFFRFGAVVSIESESLPYLEMLVKQVSNVLDGIPPSQIPIEQPREVRMVFDLDRLKVLNIRMPPHLLRRATYEWVPYP